VPVYPPGDDDLFATTGHVRVITRMEGYGPVFPCTNITGTMEKNRSSGVYYFDHWPAMFAWPPTIGGPSYHRKRP
jgi:hypothetical protein